MKRRNFLKYLSSIPLIGIPVKLLAKEKVGGMRGVVLHPDWAKNLPTEDPYEAVDFKEQLLKASMSKNPFHEGVVRGVGAKWRRVEDWNRVIASNRVGKDNFVVHDLYKALMENHSK